ncbi:MAG TPA: SxtJ family membrane protein [Gemmatimonadaceae bacterium]|nr:SxtJ family membrane protein [Gemmatimonadaceae bacterium]
MTVGSAFVVLAIVARWRAHSLSSLVLGAVGLLLLTVGIIAPASLGPVERAWMRMAHVISRVTTPVFMGVVYFAILTPVGVMHRMFAGSPLVRREGPAGYWIDREKSSRSSLERQF